MTVVQTALIRHADCALHQMGDAHPECPQRLDAIADRLISAGLDGLLMHHEAPQVTRAQLLRVHRPHYVDQVLAMNVTQGLVHLDPDTAMMAGTLPAALRAAGAAVMGVDLLMAGQAANVFCAVRPPGHHAVPDHAMGFCIFNNIAVAAAHALEAHGLQRVAVVDFDVHHGNGTQEIFWSDPSVQYASTHQMPLFPGTGEIGQRGAHDTIVNAPLSAGDGSDVFRDAMTTAILPRIDAFAPDLIIISAGFDAHRLDPIGGLQLNVEDFVWITSELMEIARRRANGRIVSLLEGGYDLAALARCASAHVQTLMSG